MKKYFKFLVFSSASLALFIFTIELVAHLVLPPAQTFSVSTQNIVVKPDNPFFSFYKTADNSIYRKTPAGNRLKKNHTVKINHHYVSNLNITVKTNSLGFRYKKLDKKKEKDFRILILGDSITLADYVAADQTYPATIEKKLNQPGATKDEAKGKRIQAINAGVGSIGLGDELALLIETNRHVEPDMVLIGLYLNDVHRSASLKLTRLPSFLSWSRLIGFAVQRIDKLRKIKLSKKVLFENSSKNFHKELTKFQAENTFSSGDWRENPSSLNKIIYSAFNDWGYSWTVSFWKDIKVLMKIFQKLSREKNFKLGVILFPTVFQVSANYENNVPQEHFNKLMRELKIPHFDLLPSLRDKYKDDQKNIYYDHCHMTSEGNAYAGSKIAQFLIDEMKL
tara:strand:- start:9627 stop:10808 length:1182 start_codon:yes stop_codon:yes gene_type:complete